MKDKKFLKVISAVLFFMIVLQLISLLLSRTNTKESWSLTKKEDVSVKEELPEEADAGNADQQEPVLDENAPVLRIFDKNMNNVALMTMSQRRLCEEPAFALRLSTLPAHRTKPWR